MKELSDKKKPVTDINGSLFPIWNVLFFNGVISA